jgi:hypothetical protein
LELSPGFGPVPTNGFVAGDMNLSEGMSRWFPSKTKIQKWIEDQEKDFAESHNKNPNLSTEDWLERHIFIDIHEIFFGGIHRELYEWLSRLEDTQFEIRSRPPVVWTSMLIKKVKGVDNALSRVVDHWFYSTIGGYITEFDVDRVESYNQSERYDSTLLHDSYSQAERIKMLLHEKNILKLQ